MILLLSRPPCPCVKSWLLRIARVCTEAISSEFVEHLKCPSMCIDVSELAKPRKSSKRSDGAVCSVNSSRLFGNEAAGEIISELGCGEVSFGDDRVN